MIEYIVIGAVVWTFLSGIVPVMIAMLRADDPYIPSRGYAEDFAARLSGYEESPGSAAVPSHSGSSSPCEAEPSDVIDFRRLGHGPRGVTTRTTPTSHSLGRSAAEKDRPQTLHLVP